MTKRNATPQSGHGDEKVGKQNQPDLIPFANWLVNDMAAKRIKNNALALKLGVNGGAISEYRRALRRPRDPAQHLLAEVFGDEVYRLLAPPVAGLLIAAPALAGAGVVAATMTGTVTPQSVIASIRAHLDSIEASLNLAGLTDEETREALDAAERRTDG